MQPISPDTFTEKSIKAINRAIEIASENQNAQLLPVHLAIAILEDEDGLLKSLLERAQGDGQVFERALKRILVRAPRQDPPPPDCPPSHPFLEVLKASQSAQKAREDSHVAI